MRDISKPFINVQYEKVDLGVGVFDIPVARLQGNVHGPAMLITAGIDGDEYAGIEAAYKLIEEFSSTPFRGTLIIIPVVNIAGYAAKVSENPLDGKYPKNIYPGKKNGSPTERLCHWLYAIARASDFWLDMHGGTLTEIITPFVSSWKSGNTVLDEKVFRIIQTLPCENAVFERPSYKTKTGILAKHNCGYIMTESGQGDDNGAKAIRRHIDWTHVVMSGCTMSDTRHTPVPKQIYTHVEEHTAKQDGIWKPQYVKTKKVDKQEFLGEIVFAKGRGVEKVYSRHNGMILWGKIQTSVCKGDVLMGVGYS